MIVAGLGSPGTVAAFRRGPMNLPTVVAREEWLAARKDLLVKEKAATRAWDALNTERRRLPMVRIEKDYVFDTPEGKRSLLKVFHTLPGPHPTRPPRGLGAARRSQRRPVHVLAPPPRRVRRLDPFPTSSEPPRQGTPAKSGRSAAYIGV